MECVILAGGYGTRLRPLTYTRQKVLIPVMNKPMIMHIIDALPKTVDRVIIAANYRKEQLRQYFVDNDIGREVFISEEFSPLGTAGAVKNAQKYITSQFMVVNSDIVASLNIEEFINFHNYSRATGTISLWPVEDVREFGVVRLEQDGSISQFVEKPSPEEAPSSLINAGHYCLEPEVLDMIEPNKMVSMEKEIFPRIIAEGKKLFGCQFKGHWIDVGKVSNYILAHRMLMKEQGAGFAAGSGCVIKGKLLYSCAGDMVTVGEGAVVRDSVIFGHAKVGAGTIITNSIVGEGCRIGTGANITGSIIGDGHSVKDGQSVTEAAVWEKPVPEGYPSGQVGNVIGQK